MGMKPRIGLAIVTSLAFAATACASGGGGEATTPDTPRPAGERIDVGETPRSNEMTDAAADHLEQAAQAESEEAAQPHFEQALDQAEMAIEADSTNPLPWFQAGVANVGLEEYETADSMLARAESLSPLYEIQTVAPYRARTWANLVNEAQPLVNQGEYDRAAEMLAGADALYEERPEAKFILGQLYLQAGRADESVELLREALAIVQSERIQEQDSMTVAQWQQQADQLPGLIADALIQAERYEEATEQLHVLLEDDPGNIVLSRNLASIYMRRELPDSAAAIYAGLLEQPELTNEDYFEIGVGMYNLEEYERAAEVFEMALDQSGRDRDAAELMARSLQLVLNAIPEGTDPAPELIDDLTRAAQMWLELDPYSRNARVIAAQAAVRRDDQDRARELIQEIENNLSINIDNLQLRRGFGGGGEVVGSVQNLTATAGEQVTLDFTFYGEDGNPIGTTSHSVTLPAQNNSEVFRVSFDSEEYVSGYTYTVEGL